MFSAVESAAGIEYYSIAGASAGRTRLLIAHRRQRKPATTGKADTMGDLPSIIELVKVVGFGAIIFVIWIITLNFFKIILQQNKEQMLALMAQQDKQWREVREDQSKRQEESFRILEKHAESLDYLAGQVNNACAKIDSNLFCPIVRKEIHPHD